MKRFLILTFFLFTSCGARNVSAQVRTFVPSVTVSGLPTAATAGVTPWFVTDGSTTTDCTAGGGTNRVACFSNGVSWAAIPFGTFSGGVVSGSTTFKGPQPWIDLSAVGGKPYTAAGDGTATCVSGNAHVTVGSSTYDYVIGDGVALADCGAAPGTAVPAISAVTPGGTAGATTYHYKIVGIAASHGYTAASGDATTATGNATLSFLNYNLVTWTCNSNFVGYVVYGAKAAAALTQIGYVDGCQYADTGYQYHMKLTLESFPANPPSSSHVGYLFTTISAISGTDYTLASAPTASASAIRIIHDGVKPMLNAIATLGALGGGTIRICVNHSSTFYFGGFILLDQANISIYAYCGDGGIKTYDEVPLFRIPGVVNNFSINGGSWGQILSVNESGTLNQVEAKWENINDAGPWGMVFIAGQSYNFTTEHTNHSGSGNIYEFAPTSLIYKFGMHWDWFQSNQVCSIVAGFGGGNSTHDWTWDNNTFEGFATQQCPQQAVMSLGAINGFTEIHDVTSDMSPVTPSGFMYSGYGAGNPNQTGLVNYVCVNCDFAIGNGPVFTGQSGSEMNLISGQYIGTGGAVLPATCIYNLQISAGQFSPAYNPATNTCGPTTALNTVAIDGYPNSGIKVFAATTGALQFNSSNSWTGTNPGTTLGDSFYCSSTATPCVVSRSGIGTNGDYRCVSSGLPAWCTPGVVPDVRTTTVEAFASTDRGKYVTTNNGSAIAVSIASAASFGNNIYFKTCNLGVGTATWTPATSTVNGNATLALTTGQCATWWSDNTNYFANVQSSPSSTDTLTNKSLASFGNGAATVTTPTSTGGLSEAFFCGATSGNASCANTSGGATSRMIGGIATLSSNAAIISSISPVFTSTSTFTCTANDITTRANPVQVANTSSSSVTITNTTGASDVISWMCVGY